MLTLNRFIIELDDNDIGKFVHLVENQLKYDNSKYEFKLDII